MIKIPKAFRKLTIGEKTEYIIKNIGISKTSIEEIRKIKQRKEKLIASAMLQKKLLGNINGNLTACIAGYSSETIVRYEFGSHFKLREILLGKYKTPKKWGPLKFSWEDEIKRIKVPEEITEDLAEETGIHIGDGNIFINEKSGDYRLFICGNLRNEISYYQEHIRGLLKKLYNADTSILKYPKKNSCAISLKSKLIINFKQNVLGLPSGKKTDIIEIPNIIKRDEKLLSSCIKGIFDTDFYLGIYKGRPHFQTQIKAPRVLSVIKNHLLNIGIENIKINKGMLFFGGKENANTFFRKIGSNNPNNYSKFLIWKEYGKCPYYTDVQERLSVISGERNFRFLENIEKERRKSAPGRNFSNT